MHSDILTKVLRTLIQQQHTGVYGLIFEGLEGMPELPFLRVFEDLGGAAQVSVSLVGAPDASALVDWAYNRGWDALTFGIGLTHAVNVRNKAPSESIKLVLVWREEESESPERLHSLVRRGYKVIGEQQRLYRFRS